MTFPVPVAGVAVCPLQEMPPGPGGLPPQHRPDLPEVLTPPLRNGGLGVALRLLSDGIHEVVQARDIQPPPGQLIEVLR